MVTTPLTLIARKGGKDSTSCKLTTMSQVSPLHTRVARSRAGNMTQSRRARFTPTCVGNTPLNEGRFLGVLLQSCLLRSGFRGRRSMGCGSASGFHSPWPGAVVWPSLVYRRPARCWSVTSAPSYWRIFSHNMSGEPIPHHGRDSAQRRPPAPPPARRKARPRSRRALYQMLSPPSSISWGSRGTAGVSEEPHSSGWIVRSSEAWPRRVNRSRAPCHYRCRNARSAKAGLGRSPANNRQSALRPA